MTQAFQKPNLQYQSQARQRQEQLTKPAGSLGRLEDIAVELAALQSVPCAERLNIVLFAADHGIASRGVSQFPQGVTAQMVLNFVRQGAAINCIAQTLNEPISIHVLGLVEPLDLAKAPNLHLHDLGPGTQDFSQHEAMSEHQLQKAMSIGADSVAARDDAHLYIAGEMGIGNTTSASALTAALTTRDPAEVCGYGTGIDETRRQHKIATIAAALHKHRARLTEPQSILRCLGGFEIAAMAGAYIACARLGLPAVVDGFISSAAALVAVRMHPEVRPWLLFSHRSKEPGHDFILQALTASPILDLGMRLGEGSGAALCVHILRVACALHHGMHTFEQAQVSQAR